MTSLRPKFTHQARNDYLAAVNWWRANRPGAERMLEQEVASTLKRLVSLPESGAPAKGARLPEVRRTFLSATRYWLYYRVNRAAAIIEVLRLWHASRGKSPKLRP